jgi:hypothetical protein
MKTAKFIELLKGRLAGGTGNTHTQTRPHSLIGLLESLALGMALSSAREMYLFSLFMQLIPMGTRIRHTEDVKPIKWSNYK